MHSVFNFFPPPLSPYQSFLVMNAKRDFFFALAIFIRTETFKETKFT